MRTSLGTCLFAAIIALAACGEAVEVEPETPDPDVAAPGVEPDTDFVERPAPDHAPPEAAADDTITFEDLAGQWRVTGVAVLDSPVQAMATNDPAYMDLVIEAGADALAWLGKAPNAIEEDCRGPVTMPQSGPAANTYRARYMAALSDFGIDAASLTPHAIECIDGTWGPQAEGGSILFSAGPNVAAMSYYDGAVLKLERTQ